MEHLLNQKLEFIDRYIGASNAADGSKFDANANVSVKNIATMATEIHKDINIAINRKLMCQMIAELYDEDLAKEYLRQLESHEIYRHDETSLMPYCVSITMYPFLMNGLKALGGESGPPKHLESFCGSFINLVFAISSQFAGAVATVEFLTYFDHFARKDLGDDYLNTHSHIVTQHFQHVVYTLNQPAAARGYQSVFWNISVYDRPYFESIFENFMFPGEDEYVPPSWESVKKLQEFFLTWFNAEREKAVLTFPVITAGMLVKDGRPVDDEFEDMCANQLANGNSFFIYESESPDSLASCCRLRNEMKTNEFSHSSGAGGVATGSTVVTTINMNRLIQTGVDLAECVKKVQKYNIAHRKIMEKYKAAGMLPVYDAGFITLDKQYLTIGINGMVEAAEYLDIKPTNNDTYKNWVTSQLEIIYSLNRIASAETGYMFNTEFVPGESLGVKHAKWDSEDGLLVPRECYNSYFYPVEDESVNVIDKFVLHGSELNKFLDGGSALHLNLEEKLTAAGFKQLIRLAAKTGCNYFCTNVKITICNECNHIDKRTLHTCSKCGSDNVDWATRIIGYLKRVSSWSSGRQREHMLRHYHRG